MITRLYPRNDKKSRSNSSLTLSWVFLLLLVSIFALVFFVYLPLFPQPLSFGSTAFITCKIHYTQLLQLNQKQSTSNKHQSTSSLASATCRCLLAPSIGNVHCVKNVSSQYTEKIQKPIISILHRIEVGNVGNFYTHKEHRQTPTLINLIVY